VSHAAGIRRHASLAERPAHVEVASTELARQINRDIVLRLVRTLQPISRVDLARVSGLQNSTVSSLVEQLLSEGWIREGEAFKTARGRRPTQITLNHRLSILVADVHPGHADVGVVDLNGQVLSRSTIPMPPDVQGGVRALVAAFKKLRATYSDRPFEGAGVCLPGRVDIKSGRLMIAPNLRWREYDIRHALQKELGMQVELENDANACLLSELWFGHLEGVRNAVLLAISEGVGASLLADGHLVAGRSGMAGEFGHICLDPEGPECGCGRKGCWEVFASTRAALEGYRELAPESGELEYAELCSRALAGDANARIALERQAGAIGRGLRMVNAALAPEVILFAGEVASAWPVAEPILLRECKAGLLRGECPRLVCTGDARLTHLLGAAAVVLQRHSGYYRSQSSQRQAVQPRRKPEPRRRPGTAIAIPRQNALAETVR
jgi:predicted NBD/HSP70 family sugar kinase